VQRFLRTVGKVIGTEVLDDIVAFFRAFEGMEQGFRDRASRVETLLAEPQTAFVLITSPRRDAVDEAEFFSAQLRDADIPTGAGAVRCSSCTSSPHRPTSGLSVGVPGSCISTSDRASG
jgi:anion-transporting  ArsA/GET3 family ATPase